MMGTKANSPVALSNYGSQNKYAPQHSQVDGSSFPGVVSNSRVVFSKAGCTIVILRQADISALSGPFVKYLTRRTPKPGHFGDKP